MIEIIHLLRLISLLTALSLAASLVIFYYGFNKLEIFATLSNAEIDTRWHWFISFAYKEKYTVMINIGSQLIAFVLTLFI